MAAILTLSLFILVLVLSLTLNFSILWALACGWALFFAYGLHKKIPPRKLFSLSLEGVSRIRTILFTFIYIGMLTAVWRMVGTVPYIALQAARFFTPLAFVLVTFLLCSVVSTLFGSAFASAATVGVICMSVGSAMRINPAYMGGAILSGVFVGDRCSPISTSALLVATLTDTDIYSNIKRMLKSSWMPFLITCSLYYFLGLGALDNAATPDLDASFVPHFVLGPVTILPAAAIIILAFFRVRARFAMAISVLIGVLICLFVQRESPGMIARTLIVGYRADDPALAAMLNGGGVVSMVRTAVIVLLSATYSGLFEGTGLLDGAKKIVAKWSKKTTPFGGVTAASVFTSLICFNQTLLVMLVHQLSHDSVKNESDLALYLEDSAILIAAMIPWSIASSVPLETVGAPTAAIGFAFYLFLVPAWNLAADWRKHRKRV